MTELDRIDLEGVGDDARAGVPVPGGSVGQLVAMDFALADVDASWGEGCDDDGGGGGGDAALPSVYDIVSDSGGTHFTNRYFEVSGVLREGPDATVPADCTGFMAIVVSSSGGLDLHTYGTLETLQGAMANRDQVVMPLYEFDNGAVKCDLRHVPRADMWSLGIASSGAEE